MFTTEKNMKDIKIDWTTEERKLKKNRTIDRQIRLPPRGHPLTNSSLCNNKNRGPHEGEPLFSISTITGRAILRLLNGGRGASKRGLVPPVGAIWTAFPRPATVDQRNN